MPSIKSSYLSKNKSNTNKNSLFSFKMTDGSSIELSSVFYVEEIEYEAGWGTRIEDNYFFKSFDDALTFIKKYNFENENNNDNWAMYCSEPYSCSAYKLDNNNVVIQSV